MTQIAIMKFSELGSRLDADFHIARKSVEGRLAQFEGEMTKEAAQAVLRLIPNRLKQALLPLHRGSEPTLSARNIDRIEAEYPHLAIALLEKDAGRIRAKIEAEVARGEDALGAVNQLIHSRRNAKPESPAFKAGHVYPLLDPETYDDDHGTGFAYAAIPHDAEPGTAFIHDAWIVNAEGGIHPGLNDCPVPIRIDAVDITKGRPFTGELPVPKDIFDSPLFRR